MDKKKGLKNSRKIILSVVAIVVLIVSVCGFQAYRLYHGTITTISSINEVEEYGAGDFFRLITKIMIMCLSQKITKTS